MTGNLPTGWRWARLGDVTTGPATADPRKRGEGTFQYVDISSIDSVQKSITQPSVVPNAEAPSRARQIIRSNDVLISGTRPNLNAVAKVPPELDGAICSTGFAVLRPTEHLDSDWLLSFVCTREFVDTVSHMVVGALYPAVTDRQVRSVPIPVPALAEQRRIAALLRDQLDTVRRAREAALARLEAARALPSAFLGSVLNSRQARNWPKVRLGDICTIHPGQHIMEDDYNRLGVGIGYLTGPADFGETQATVTKWTGSPKVMCQPSDILVTVKGAGVGKTNLAPDQPAAIGRQLMAVRCDPSTLNHMVLFGLLTLNFRALASAALGSTVPGLDRQDVASLVSRFRHFRIRNGSWRY